MMISNSGPIMTLANSIIGVGILAMPFCFQKCGIVLSVVLLIVSNLITRVSCHYLIKSSLLTRRKSFEFLGFHGFGSSGKLLVELCIIGYLMGTCITYFVVVGDVGPQIVSKMLGLDGAGLRTWVLVVVTIICILPLGMLKNVDSLSAVCTASVGFYLCLVAKIFLESESHILANDWSDKVIYWDPSGILQCLPIYSMALSCQMQLFEVLQTVNNQSLDKQNAIVKNATWICTVVYVAVGFFGYVAYCTQPFAGNILVNLTPTFSSDVIKIGFVLSVAFSFPLVIFPCRASIYSLLYKRGHTDATVYIPEARFKAITVFIVTFALCIALLIPSIELVIGLVGSTIGVAICIIFPAMCFRKVSKKESTERTLAQAIIVGGCCLMVLGTYANLNAIDESRSGPVQISVPSSTVIASAAPPFQHILENPKDLIKEVPLQNLSAKADILKKSVEKPNRIPSPVVEKKPDQPKVNPPLPVDEVEDEPIKSAEKSPPEMQVIKPTPAPIVKSVSNDLVLPAKDIAKEAIKKEDEIDAEEQQQKESDTQKELVKAQNELEKAKELLERKVDELKEELAKQNKETQELVAEKLGEVVEKVEKIEREVHKDQKLQAEQGDNTPGPIKSVIEILSQTRNSTETKEKQNKNASELLSHQSRNAGKITKINSPQQSGSDRLSLPLPLLMNASQTTVGKPKVIPVQLKNETTNKLKLPITSKELIGDSAVKLNQSAGKATSVDKTREKVSANNSLLVKIPIQSSTPVDERSVDKEKNNIEAIRRDILEVDTNHNEVSTEGHPREKRSASNLNFAEINTKLEKENCLSEAKLDSLLATNSLDAKVQGLGRDLKSLNGDE